MLVSMCQEYGVILQMLSIVRFEPETFTSQTPKSELMITRPTTPGGEAHLVLLAKDNFIHH